MTDPLISQYLDWLKLCKKSDRTIDARRDILGRMDRQLPDGLVAATAEELSEWIYREEFSDWTQATYYGAARSFFVWATNPADPKVDFNPTELLPRPEVAGKIPNPISDGQLQHILTHAAEPYLTWAKIAAYTGARCCEIAELRREHIDEKHVLMVRRKGGRPGLVNTHQVVWDAVKDLPPGPIAWTTRGEPANAHYISIYSAVYFRRQLRMPGVHMHRLRGWFITSFYRQTRDTLETAAAAGHRKLDTTMSYIQLEDEKRAAGIRALPNLTGA